LNYAREPGPLIARRMRCGKAYVEWIVGGGGLGGLEDPIPGHHLACERWPQKPHPRNP